MVLMCGKPTASDQVYNMHTKLACNYLETEITLSGNNETVAINVFQITGSVEIHKIFAEITDATTLNNCTAVYLDLYDGTNNVEITNNGATLSGMAVGTFLVKNKSALSSLTIANNDQCRMTEETTIFTQFAPFIVTQKTNTNTYVRFNYATTDTPINAKIKIYVEFRPLDGGGLVIA